jgi:hypothetical protein
LIPLIGHLLLLTNFLLTDSLTSRLTIVIYRGAFAPKKSILATLLLSDLGIAYFHQKYKGFQGFLGPMKDISIISIKNASSVILMQYAFLLMPRHLF